MAVLLLDPLLLTLAVAVATYAWAVWSGRFTGWFTARRLVLVAWPLPVVALVVPLLVGPLLRATSVLDADEAPGLLGGAVFLLATVVPVAGLSLAPSRWLLPPWARRRLVPLPPPAGDGLPALHVSHVDGRLPWPRWRWRIDGIAGHLYLAGGRLRFEAADLDPTAALIDLDAEELDQLDLALGEDPHLRPPRGGWWTRRRLEVVLAELDDVRVLARRPWDRTGLLVLTVAGRRPVRLLTVEAHRVADEIGRRHP